MPRSAFGRHCWVLPDPRPAFEDRLTRSILRESIPRTNLVASLQQPRLGSQLLCQSSAEKKNRHTRIARATRWCDLESRTLTPRSKLNLKRETRDRFDQKQSRSKLFGRCFKAVKMISKRKVFTFSQKFMVVHLFWLFSQPNSTGRVAIQSVPNRCTRGCLENPHSECVHIFGEGKKNRRTLRVRANAPHRINASSSGSTLNHRTARSLLCANQFPRHWIREGDFHTDATRPFDCEERI